MRRGCASRSDAVGPIEELAQQAHRRGRHEAGDELAKLTRRQQEVAACVAEGLTNEQIAVRLVLTPGTVANHMEAILRRLDLGSRTQVGIWAVERGLFRSDSDDDRQRRTIVTSAIHL